MKSQSLRLALAITVLWAGAQGAFPQSTPAPVPADNAKANKADSSNTTATADAQKDNASDRTATQRIRQSVMADKSLPTYAYNVKIVTVNGGVTLNGVVRSDAEKSTIEAKAISVAGKGRVVNELKVTAPRS